MKLAKTVALTGALAVFAAVAGGTAFAASSTPAASDTHAKCEHQGKDKKLSGEKLKDFVKKCEADAAKK